MILLGLANGSVLYTAMEYQTHPLGVSAARLSCMSPGAGKWFNNLKYPALYEYLNCLQISPCTGWMNSNGARVFAAA